MHRFFSNEIHGQEILLDAEESRHLAKVLRLQANEEVEVIDGTTWLYRCRIVKADARKSQLLVVNKEKVAEKAFGIHLAVAPTKNLSRWEWFLEKATEIGIDRITPLLCEHSERKVLKTERSRRILIGAMKQSLKTALPQLDELTPFQEFIGKCTNPVFMAHCEDSTQKVPLKTVARQRSKNVILIGPEGDFSPAEIQMAREHQIQEISLGESRLRTETAALVACHTLHLLDA